MIHSLHELLARCLRTDNWRFILLKEWPNIFGPLSSRVCIESIHDATLVLGVTDSCLMQELYLLSPLILVTIQKSLGNTAIKQIRFKRTEMGTPVMKHAKKIVGVPERKEVSLTRAEMHALDCMQDTELKEALRKYCLRCHRERDA